MISETVWPSTSCCAPVMISTNALSDGVRARGQAPVVEHVPRLGPERAARGLLVEQAGGHERRRAVAGGRRIGGVERVHHDLADAARGHVDHAAEADVVVRVDDQLEIGERVLDLFALVEPHAADHPIRQAFAGQRVFDRARLGVHAVEHRDDVLGVVGELVADRAQHEVRLLELVLRARVDDLLAAAAVGPQLLVLALAVLADHRRRGVEDHLRRAVVLLEAHDQRRSGSRARSRGCSSHPRRATCRSTGRDRRRPRGCRAPTRAAAPAGTAAGWCPGTRRSRCSWNCVA